MRPTQSFLDECKGLVFNEDLGCFTDPADGTNWWPETLRSGFVLRNRDTGQRVDREFAEACIEGTRIKDGGIVRADGKTHQITIKLGFPQIKKG